MNLQSIFRIVLQPYFYLGIFLYIIGIIINILVLKHLPYSIVMPLSSVTYIWTLLISYILLRERITKLKVIGVFFIIFGSVCIGIGN